MKNIKELKINFLETVYLAVGITENMVRDREECERMANLIGDGKDCAGCSLNVDVLGTGLCEIPVVTDALTDLVKGDKNI